MARPDSGSVPAVPLPERPGIARRAIGRLDVAEAPPDLGGRIGRPVGARCGHLRAWQRLWYAVGAAGVLRVVAPAALPGPDVVQAAELTVREAKRRQHVVGD